MDKYERNISLRTIYLTIIRRFKTILLFFVPIALIVLVFTTFIMTKTYQSSATITNASGSAISTQAYQSMQLALKKTEFIDSVVEQLKTDEVKHSNKKEIVASEITSGLSFGTLATNSISVKISFQSTDSKIVQPVLKTLTTKYAESQTTYNVTSEASGAVKNSSERKYLLIGVAAGLVVACGIAFLDEIFSDEVYDAKDIANYGIPAFDMKVRKEA